MSSWSGLLQPLPNRSIHLSIHLLICSFNHLSIHPPNHSSYRSAPPPVFSIYHCSSIHPSIHPPTLFIHPPISLHPPTTIHPPICSSIYPSVHPPSPSHLSDTLPSIHSIFHPPICSSIHRCCRVCLSWTKVLVAGAASWAIS